MSPINYVLAFALLTAPPDAPDPSVSLEVYQQLQSPIEKLALEWEIMDDREVGFLLTKHHEFAAEIRMLRRRYDDHRDSPMLQDSYRFPDRDIIHDLLSFNRSYRQHLETRMTIETVRWWELHEALQETDRLYYIWDSVREARCHHSYITSRRHALKRLRELLGDEAYFAGTMPSHVPIWRFQRID